MTWLDAQPAEKVDASLADLRATGGERWAQRVADVDGDERFALWLLLVDQRMQRAVGVTHRDIGDWTWRDAYDGGYSPREAMREGLEADDTYSALFG